MTEPRRFPVPWTFEEHNGACFIVKDANDLAVAYVYYEEQPRRRTTANLMTQNLKIRRALLLARLVWKNFSVKRANSNTRVQ